MILVSAILVVGGGVILADLAWRLCVRLGGERLLLGLGQWELRCLRRLGLLRESDA